MHTPVDFEKEIGQNTDHAQAKLGGVSTLLMAVAASFLMLVPNDWAGRLWIVVIALSIASAGGALLPHARRHRFGPPPESILDELQPDTPLNPVNT